MTQVLHDLLRGRGAHVDPVATVSGLNAEIAGRYLAGAQHSIWQLVWHMNYWMDYEVRSIEGAEVPYPVHATASWPVEAAPPSPAAWNDAVDRFTGLVTRLGDWVDRAAAGDADRIVHRKKSESVLDVLWQTVAHNSYHIGQVALLRRAFGAWPPAGGGDTW